MYYSNTNPGPGTHLPMPDASTPQAPPKRVEV